jgi:seryl-tRNA synthetase
MSQDETVQQDTIETSGEVENTETVENEKVYEQYPDDHPLVQNSAKLRQEVKKLRQKYADASTELDEIRKSQLSDTERLIEQTKDDTRRAVRLEFAEKLVEAELKSSLKGRTLEGDSILTFDKTAFIDDSGDIDSEAIATWVEAHSTHADAPKPDLGQGARGDKNSLAQVRTRDELTNMSPAEILQARKDGRLDALMGKS